jgi:hypothetical protein
VDGPKRRHVVVDLLEGDQVEPAEELGEEAMVLVPALLAGSAEVGDVPGREEESVGRLRRNGAVGLLRMPA